MTHITKRKTIKSSLLLFLIVGVTKSLISPLFSASTPSLTRKDMIVSYIAHSMIDEQEIGAKIIQKIKEAIENCEDEQTKRSLREKLATVSLDTILTQLKTERLQAQNDLLKALEQVGGDTEVTFWAEMEKKRTEGRVAIITNLAQQVERERQEKDHAYSVKNTALLFSLFVGAALLEALREDSWLRYHVNLFGSKVKRGFQRLSHFLKKEASHSLENNNKKFSRQ